MNLENLKTKMYIGILSFSSIYTTNIRGVPKGKFFGGNLKFAKTQTYFCRFLHYLFPDFNNFCTTIITKLFSVILIQWSPCRVCALSLNSAVFYEKYFFFPIWLKMGQINLVYFRWILPNNRTKIPKDCNETSIFVPHEFG